MMGDHVSVENREEIRMEEQGSEGSRSDFEIGVTQYDSSLQENGHSLPFPLVFSCCLAL